ncbi:phosphate transport system regulatory protein PhoU [bacterium]|nr:phosphate transport system regulatory protein PhoU [bacterium]
MSYRMNKEIEYLKRVFLSVSTLVEENVAIAFDSFVTMNPEKARLAIQNDADINREEMDVEEECLKILALHQPVASELRYIVSVLKINSTLERIGDLAVSVAKKSQWVMDAPPPLASWDIAFQPMMDGVRLMLKNSLDSLINVDVGLAREVCRMDDDIDEQKQVAHRRLVQLLTESKADVGVILHVMSIIRHVERMADHAAHIAQVVIYLGEGAIIRHQRI